MRDDEYFAIKERAAKYLLTLPHVTAVGLGPRETEGHPTGEIAIKVFVLRKRPLDEVPVPERIPRSFEGVPTDVAEMGPLQRTADIVPGVTHAGGMLPDIDPRAVLRGGISLSAEGKKGLGTLGCILLDKLDGTTVYALTNHHVVTPDGKISRSRRVAHPSELDGSFGFIFEEANSFGIVAAARDEPILDAALVRLSPGARWLPFVEQIGFITGRHDLTLADVRNGDYQVRKRGAKTKLTGGVVVCIEGECLEITTTIDNIVRKKNIFVRPNPADENEDGVPDPNPFFSFEGDSGSVLVNDDNEIVGLLYAGDQSTTGATPGHGIGVPIDTVFRRFFETMGLDLAVATPVTEEPSEESEAQEVPQPAGVPTISVPEQVERGDHAYYRPLIGGVQIMTAPMIANGQSATLGCIVTEEANPSAAYILTSYGAVSAEGTIPPTGDTKVGQPNNEGSCTGCCSNTVGRYSKGGPTHQTPTASLVRLGNDQRWLAEILQVGVLNGSGVAVAGDNVVKYGAASGLTGGKIVNIDPLPDTVLAGSIMIRPHPNPDAANPQEDLHFSRFVDRGAAVVNKDREVVAILYDEHLIDDPDGRKVFHGVAMPIGTVLQALEQHAGVKVEVPVAAAIDDVRTATARTALDPQEAAAELPGLLPEDVIASPAGRVLGAAWREHERELRELVDRNRRVATVWHRNGGPQMLQALVRASRSPASTLPTTINGRRVSDCLERIAQVFSRYGSAALRTDLALVRPLIPPLGGLSLSGLIDALNEAVASHAR